MKLILAAMLLLCSTPRTEAWAENQTRQTKARCEAVTKKGTRCKNKVVEGSKYCLVHQANDPKVKQCKAKTQSGTQCRRAAKTSGYCQQHYRMYCEGKLKLNMK